MNKLYRGSLMVVGVAAITLPLFALAEDMMSSTTRGELHQERVQTRQENRAEHRTMVKSNMQMRRDLNQTVDAERRALLQQLKTLSPDDGKTKLEAFHQDVEQKRETLREDIETKREEFRNDAEKRQEELKKTIGEVRAKRIEEFFNQMMERMDAAIDRLDKLAARIQSRLDKLAADGKNVSTQQTLLDKAKTSITAAQSAIDDAKAKFTTMASSTDPKAEFAQVRDAVVVVRDKTKDAHAALVDVINSIKVGGLDASSTSATSTQSDH